jgi:uncharacterized protein (DUF2237 family)
MKLVSNDLDKLCLCAYRWTRTLPILLSEKVISEKESDKGAELRSKLQLTDEIFVQHESTLPT